MIKKLLGIVVLGLLLSGCASSDRIVSGGPGNIIKKDEYKIELGYTIEQGAMEYSHVSETGEKINRKIASEHCATHSKFAYEQRNDWLNHTGETMVYLCDTKKLETTYWNNYDESSKLYTLAKKEDLTFTIKDKKEQCTAIGFAPATEKFADCVLRLVELDVKSQQATQIALAQSQGNQQVVDQLKKQRNDQSSQYFLDLGQKLLNPQSTVSAPTTSTCRVTGGVYKTVSCW